MVFATRPAPKIIFGRISSFACALEVFSFFIYFPFRRAETLTLKEWALLVNAPE
jgi:hypothetical protein